MKINATPTNRPRQISGFTLIEMIGVLAVIAILAALLLPKVFTAISDAKIASAVIGAETIKTAVADHYGKYGKFETVFGTTNITVPALPASYQAYDVNVLLAEGLIEKPFTAKIGTNWTIQLRQCEQAGTVVTGINAAYSLDGSGTNTAIGQYVVEAVIQGVPELDAQGLSLRLDGNSFSTSVIGNPDMLGRVKYAPATPATAGQTDIYIYLTHR